MHILLLIIILLYQIIETILGVKEIHKLKEKKITEKIRIKFYCETILCGWIPTIIITIFIIFKNLTTNDIGLREIQFNNYTWLNVVTIIIISIILLLIFYQSIMFIISKKYREALAFQINKNTQTDNHYNRVIYDIMLPKTIKEKVCFFFCFINCRYL